MQFFTSVFHKEGTKECKKEIKIDIVYFQQYVASP